MSENRITDPLDIETEMVKVDVEVIVLRARLYVDLTDIIFQISKLDNKYTQ